MCFFRGYRTQRELGYILMKFTFLLGMKTYSIIFLKPATTLLSYVHTVLCKLVRTVVK